MQPFQNENKLQDINSRKRLINIYRFMLNAIREVNSIQIDNK